MTKLSDYTTNQLRDALALRGQIEKLERKLGAILGGGEIPIPFVLGNKKRGRPPGSKSAKKRRKMSAAGRARLSAGAKLRWKKAKAAGKSRL